MKKTVYDVATGVISEVEMTAVDIATIPVISDDRKLELLRAERNQRLANTDWWVMPDRTATQAQLNYRQELRDITDTYSSLDTVVWPQEP